MVKLGSTALSKEPEMGIMHLDQAEQQQLSLGEAVGA